MCSLFVAVNYVPTPPEMRDAFKGYIARTLANEIARIPACHGGRESGCRVVERGAALVGTFGLERTGADPVDLRRMYVGPAAQRRGIARTMAAYADAEARRRGADGAQHVRAPVGDAGAEPRGGLPVRAQSGRRGGEPRIVGADIRRFHFAKMLSLRTPRRNSASEARTWA